MFRVTSLLACFVPVRSRSVSVQSGDWKTKSPVAGAMALAMAVQSSALNGSRRGCSRRNTYDTMKSIHSSSEMLLRTFEMRNTFSKEWRDPRMNSGGSAPADVGGEPPDGREYTVGRIPRRIEDRLRNALN